LQQAGHFDGELSATSTSLELESKHAIDRTAVLGAILTQLDAWLVKPGQWSYDELRAAWIKRASFLGEPICVRERDRVFCGTIVDLDPAASVVVQLDEGGVRAFNAAETTVESIGSMRPSHRDFPSRKQGG
jgi:biotin-(acetyl-CoA carboxylase) ligase